MIKRLVGREKTLAGLQLQNFQISSTMATVWANSHRSLFSGGLWTAEFRALAETVRGLGIPV